MRGANGSRAVGAALLLAVGLNWTPPAGAQPYAPPPSDFTAYWDVPAFKDFPYTGPEKAKGVLFWSHGVAGRDPQYHFAPPEIIKDFARAGWDVVKIQRNNLHEAGWSTSGTRHVADLVERTKKAREQGYRLVIAAGQSYGGAISLEASAKTDQLFGVIAFAPGHGSDACGRSADTLRRISDNLQRQLVDAIERAKAARLVVLMADGDECQGFNEPSKLINGALRRTPAKFLHFDASMPVRGHGAASTAQFRAWYGKCLLDFLDPEKEPSLPETRCNNPSPVPRFLFPDNYQFPTSAPAQTLAKLIGPWSGVYAAEAANADNGREICIVIEGGNELQINALGAFGPGTERKLSMAGGKRTFGKDGNGFVYKGSEHYRMALTPAADDTIRLTITSPNGKITWTGTLRRGC